MAAGDSKQFDEWLSVELVKFNEEVDLEIFVAYIKGILDSESGEELDESLFEIVSQLKTEEEESAKDFCNKIILRWKEEEEKEDDENQEDENVTGVNFHDLISLKMQDHTIHHSHKALQDKDSILKNYSHVSSGEDSEGETQGAREEASSGKGAREEASSSKPQKTDDNSLVRNINALTVKNREKEMREKSRKDTEVKKQKDKDDKEKQKNKEKERKEGEKKRTQKGEKRRG